MAQQSSKIRRASGSEKRANILSDISPRIRVRELAPLLGLQCRTVTQHAAAGRIPSARKFGDVWTFDAEVIRNWLTEKECDKCQMSIAPKERETTITASGSTASSTADRFKQLIGARRKPSRSAA